MDKLQECALAFKEMLNIQYNITLGRKGKTTSIALTFSESDFHHLCGLHKIIDNDYLRTTKRSQVFDDIIKGKLSFQTLSNSSYFEQVEIRIDPLIAIEQMLDADNLIFRYNDKVGKFSLILAEYLLSTSHKDREVYVFIDKHPTGQYFCRSFFPKGNKDYTVGQARHTVLYKEKLNLASGENKIQIDKLTPL